jgi:hypothetical protein
MLSILLMGEDVRVICQKWLLWRFSEIWHHIQLLLISLSFRFNVSAYMSSHDSRFYFTILLKFCFDLVVETDSNIDTEHSIL